MLSHGSAKALIVVPSRRRTIDLRKEFNSGYSRRGEGGDIGFYLL
jgi:hypothetical protein